MSDCRDCRYKVMTCRGDLLCGRDALMRPVRIHRYGGWLAARINGVCGAEARWFENAAVHWTVAVAAERKEPAVEGVNYRWINIAGEEEA
jgi:hypothetical protein